MPLKSGRETKKEKAFKREMVALDDPVRAARLAGYVNPYSAAQELMNRPQIAGDILREQNERLTTVLLPKATNRLEKILDDDTAGARAHIAAAKLVYDNTLRAGDNSNGKEPHEMTADELAERIARLRQQQADIAHGAKDVTPPEDGEQGENTGDAFG